MSSLGGGAFEGTIDPLPDRAVVEFFVDGTDSTGSSSWPTGAAGALFQVDASHASEELWTPGRRPIYRAVLREVDRAILVSGTVSAPLFGTFASVDGTGVQTIYRTEFRLDSTTAPPSFTAVFPPDRLWNGRPSFDLRSRFPHTQVLGATVFRQAGLPSPDAAPVRFRVNGSDLAETGQRMFGGYARLERIEQAWTARQFPLDPGGNLYFVDDHGPGTHGELAYETPPTASNYGETYLKRTNIAAADYSDIIALTDQLSNGAENNYRAELSSVLHLDQWLTFLAVDSLMGNVRSGLQSGRGDGFFLYRGVVDSRFVLVPGELDTLFGLGENGTGDAVTRSIFSYENVAGLSRLMNHPDVLPDYYAKLLRLMETTLAPGHVDALIDQVGGDWVDASTLQSMKAFITARRNFVSAQIPRTFGLSLTTTAPDVEGIKQTMDGAATASGTFDVSRVRSIRVNGQAATLYYRTNGVNPAGSWTCPIPAGFNRGMNLVTARFYSGAAGTGELVHELTTELYYSGEGTSVSGPLGVGAPQILFSYGNLSTSTPGSTWKYRTDFTQASLATFITDFGTTWKNEGFDDSTWSTGTSQLGYGDSPRDEQTVLTRVDYVPGGTVQSAPSYLFRNTFTLAAVTGLASVTAEVKFDDSCAVYVNGTQVYRHGDLTENAPLTEYTEISTPTTRENATATFNVPLTLLHDGVNAIAVEVHQHDVDSSDMTFDLKLEAAVLTSAEVRWTSANSPYRLVGDVTIPQGVTLVVDPGVSVFADHNRRLTVNGIVKVLGTPEARVRFSHLPGAPLQDDPREPGTQTVPPKWGGILITDSLSPENIIRYADFVNAQPAPVEGCVTVIRSECFIEHCSFRGTYLHGVYGRNCSLTVQDSYFPSVFPPGKEALGEVLDNLSEFVEVDSPPEDPGVLGRPEFFEGFPVGGHLRLYRNLFEGSSGHNDLIDITAGKWGVTPLLDVQDNHFRGPTGDEHIDLNGDAYVAGNFFENCKKDIYTSDQGYANAISSDVGETDTTVVVSRNVFSKVDHAVNVKRGSGAIFEHNTVADINADYLFTRGTFTQNVRTSAVNFFIPEDSGRAGDGAYSAFNLCFGRVDGAGFTRVFSWADLDLAGQPARTTKIEMTHNFLDGALLDPFIGAQHTANALAPVWQPRIGDPLFVDRAAQNYNLLPYSPARGTAPHGLDYGASIPSGCYLGNVPPALTTATSANLIIGGPGVFAFKWRLDGGPWSAPVVIAPGVFPRLTPTIRTATLALPSLSNGPHTVEVVGQDFAGNWQTTPTVASWTIDSTLQRIILSEIVADALAAPDSVELHNAGANPVSLDGWFLTNLSSEPTKFSLTGTIEPGAYLTVALTNFDLHAAGDELILLQGAEVRDTIEFGRQITRKSIGRVGRALTWTLCQPTPNAPNVALALADADKIRINELLAADGPRFEEGWIELLNTAPAPAALSGLRLTDNLAGNPTAYIFPPLSFIDAGGYLKIGTGGNIANGDLSFLFDAQGGNLSLLRDETILDSLNFGAQTVDISVGRNASGALVYFDMPTAGFANTTVEPKTYREWLSWHATIDGRDEDADQSVAFAEYALASDPEFPDSSNRTPSAAIQAGQLAMGFSLPENPAEPGACGRSEVTYHAQVSDGLKPATWTTIATKAPGFAWTGTVTVGAADGGLISVTVRDPRPIAESQTRFVRLVMLWTP